ncbi:MAG: hypothetical protein C0594_17035 [Marinilabiliales bacterium]|nr:MAG: hypothetical protein C0594_17035 [Marinilabiliales bacterium]
MNNILVYTFLIFFTISGYFTLASEKTDSLENLILNANHDSLKIEYYLQLGFAIEESNPQKSLSLYKEAASIAKRYNKTKMYARCLNNCGIVCYLTGDLHKAVNFFNKALIPYSALNDSSGMADIYGNLGIMYKNLGEYEKSIDSYSSSIYLKRKIQDTLGVIYGYSNLGIVLKEQGKYNEAAKNTLEAIHYLEKTSYTKELATAYLSLGMILMEQLNFDKAIGYYLQSKQLYQKISNKKGLSAALLNIGDVYLEKKNYKESREYFNKAATIKEELEDKRGLAYCYNNMGISYKGENKLADAEKYYLLALKLKKETSDKKGIATTLGNLAELSLKTKNYKQAIDYAGESLKISTDIGALSEISYAHIHLSDAYASLNNTSKAYFHLQEYIILKDSVYNLKRNKQIEELETKYQTEKKQLVIDNLEKEKEIDKQKMIAQKARNRQQTLIIYGFIVVLFIIVIFSTLLYRVLIQKKRANKLLALQNKKIQGQKQEIDDSIHYARQIQRAVLSELEHTIPNSMEYFVLFKPKDVVSGDFYWGTRINEWLILAAADCTGHGVPGAFMSMLGVSFLNEIVRKNEVTKTSDVLNLLRNNIIDALKQKEKASDSSSLSIKDGMDIRLVVINTQTLICQWSGANNPLYIVRKGKLFEEIKPEKQPIAIHVKMTPFTNHETKLQKGDIIYLITDGFPDQFGGKKGKKFKYKKFKQLLIDNSDKPMEEQKNALKNSLHEWMSHTNPYDGNPFEQVDDITILGLKI